jgi:hypothetical protein
MEIIKRIEETKPIDTAIGVSGPIITEIVVTTVATQVKGSSKILEVEKSK